MSGPAIWRGRNRIPIATVVTPGYVDGRQTTIAVSIPPEQRRRFAWGPLFAAVGLGIAVMALTSKTTAPDDRPGRDRDPMDPDEPDPGESARTPFGLGWLPDEPPILGGGDDRDRDRDGAGRDGGQRGRLALPSGGEDRERDRRDRELDRRERDLDRREREEERR